MAKVFTKENFDREVLNSEVPVMVDFFASWCGPCKMMGPVIDKISEEATDFKVGKIDIDEQPELAAKYGIMSIPTVMVFKEGKPVNVSMGLKTKRSLMKMVN